MITYLERERSYRNVLAMTKVHGRNSYHVCYKDVDPLYVTVNGKPGKLVGVNDRGTDGGFPTYLVMMETNDHGVKRLFNNPDLDDLNDARFVAVNELSFRPACRMNDGTA